MVDQPLIRRRRRRAAPSLSAIGPWKPESYLIAEWRGSPKGRRPPAWNVTHVGTGLRLCIIEAHEAAAYALAGTIAAMADWGFDGPEGWRNRDPDLMEKMKALILLHPQITHCGGDPGEDRVWREIALARAR
jgi:hypothetical protein